MKLESPPLFGGNPTDTPTMCSVSSSASSSPSSKPILSLRSVGSYHNRCARSPARPIWFENRSAVPAPMLRGPYSTTVMSADQIVTSATDTDGATSSSSTVSDAEAAPGASCQPGPEPSRTVTRLSFSDTVSASVGTRSSVPRAPAANVASAGAAVPSIAPVSSTVTGTVSALRALPARVSRNTASSPSVA